MRLSSAISFVSLASHPLPAPLMQADGASLYLLLCPGFVHAAREGAELRGLESPSCLWLRMGAAHAPGRDHGCVLETRFLTSQWREGANLASVQVMGISPSCERWGAGAWHVAVHARRSWRGCCVSPLPPVLPHRGPSVALGLWKASGATRIRWPRGCPSWLLHCVMPGVALSRSRISVLSAHEPSHLRKAFAKSPAGKASSRASHPPSIPLGARVRDQSLRQYEAEPSCCPRPGSRHPQRVGTGLWLPRFLLLSNIYSGAQVWLGVFALKAQE